MKIELKLYSIFDFYLHKTHTQTYKILVEKNGVARGIKTRILIFFSLCYPRDTPGFPQKMSTHSVHPFGWPEGTLYTNVLFFM